VIQAAVDSIARWAEARFGFFRVRTAFAMLSIFKAKVRILGSGLDSVNRQGAFDRGEAVAGFRLVDQRLRSPMRTGFQVATDLPAREESVKRSVEVIKRTLVARTAIGSKLDSGLRKNVWLMGEPKVESLFPLFSARTSPGVTIENIALDGNKATNGNLDGNYARLIWMQDCNRINCAT